MTTIVLKYRPGFRQTPNTFCIQILNSHRNVVKGFQNKQSAVGLLPTKKVAFFSSQSRPFVLVFFFLVARVFGFVDALEAVMTATQKELFLTDRPL